MSICHLSLVSITYAKACVKPAFDYFNSKFGTDLEKAVSAFKYARFFDPVKIVEIKPSASDIERLRIFPFLDSDSIIDGLKVELPKYLATAEDISPEIDRLEWWKNMSVISLTGLQECFARAAIFC